MWFSTKKKNERVSFRTHDAVEVTVNIRVAFHPRTSRKRSTGSGRMKGRVTGVKTAGPRRGRFLSQSESKTKDLLGLTLCVNVFSYCILHKEDATLYLIGGIKHRRKINLSKIFVKGVNFIRRDRTNIYRRLKRYYTYIVENFWLEDNNL